MQPAMARPAHLRHRAHRVVRLSPLVAAILLAVAPAALAAGPPYPDPVDGQAVYDTANLFQPETRTQAEGIIDAIEAQTKAEVVVYTQALGRDDITTEDAESDAKALMDQWGVGRAGLNDAARDPVRSRHAPSSTARCSCSPGRGSRSRTSRTTSARRSTRATMLPLLQEQQFDEALLGALGRGRDRDLRRDATGHAGGAAGAGHQPGPALPRSRGRPRGLRLRRHPLAGGHRRGRNRRSTRSRRGPAPRSWSTPSSPTTACRPEETEAAGDRADRPMGRRAEGLRRRAGDLLRHRSVAPARPGPALCRPRVRGGLPLEQRTPEDLRRGHAPVPTRGRLRRRPERGAHEGGRRRDAGARGPAPARSPDQRGRRPGRRADRRSWVSRAGRSPRGGASARTRSTSTTPRSSCRPRRPN